MSGAGAPKLKIDASGLAVSILVTSWHTKITDGLLAGAERALKDAGNDVYSIVRVAHSSCHWLRSTRLKKALRWLLPSEW